MDFYDGAEVTREMIIKAGWEKVSENPFLQAEHFISPDGELMVTIYDKKAGTVERNE